ncbi:MAG TPA: hypothetical protein VFE78_16910 [Gemmataceae bacterium]|jgi:hypothetical protein|nr:hypothetical protein [Gemmataceae bacterium]
MRPVLLPLLTAALLGLSAADVRADEVPAPDVTDGAGLFTPAAVTEAERLIADVRKDYHLGLMVETAGALPALDRKWFYFWDRRKRNEFLENWARERAKAAGADGVFVEICNHPRDVHVVVWPPERGQSFTAADCERTRRFLVNRLQTGGRDEALLATVKEVADLLEARKSGQDDESLSANAFVVGGVVAGLFGVWGALQLARLRLRRAAPDGGAQDKADRAVERPARMAALFGTPAAFWLYDKLFLKLPPAPAAAPLFFNEPAATPDPPGEFTEGADHADAPVQDAST